MLDARGEARNAKPEIRPYIRTNSGRSQKTLWPDIFLLMALMAPLIFIAMFLYFSSGNTTMSQ